MSETDYMLHPLGRNLMIAFLGAVFLSSFFLTPLFLIPINALINSFVDFTILPTLTVRGILGVVISIVTTSLLIERIYDRIGWYKFSLPDTKTLRFHYRSTISKEYSHIDFNLRKTRVEKIEKLLWLISTDNNFSILVLSPDEIEGIEFYEKLDVLLEENIFKVKKQFEDKKFSDYPYHYMINRGKLKKLWADQFTMVTGLSSFIHDDLEENDYVPERKEVEEAIKFAENVDLLV